MTVGGQGAGSAGALVAVSGAKTSVSSYAPSRQTADLPASAGTIGLILPPPDLRAIVDKTAQFIAKNGEEFEQRIIAQQKDNTKFKFLSRKDPYHAYYKAKIAECQGGSPAVAAEGGAAEGVSKPPTPAVVVKDDAQAKRGVVVDQVLETPAGEEYTVRAPDGLAPLDLDVVRLTAQFVARNGQAFLQGVASREYNNPQFHFLKATHSLNPFFSELVSAYERVLHPSAGALEALRKDESDPAGVLARCLRRLEWMRVQEEEKRSRESKEEAERTAMALIDWNDFVVVETIAFLDGEDGQLPEPLSAKDLIAVSKAEQAADEGEEAAMEVEMDEEEEELVREAQATAMAVPTPEPTMKVVKNYKRPSRTEGSRANLVVSPITGELVPVDDMAEHMRISLLDPKWKEQRDAYLAKQRDTTKATDDEIARNVSSLARKMERGAEEEEEERSAKKLRK